MTFAQRVQEMKKKKNMTSAQISEKAGIPLGTLNKLLTGAIEEPRLSVAVAIAGALGCALSELVEEDNSLLPTEETALLAAWRNLDEYGKTMVRTVLEMESGRKADADNVGEAAVVSGTEGETLEIPLYLLPVSAGTGAFLDSTDHESLSVRRTPVTEKADFALRISGNSMEPRFHDGDVLLIHQQTQVNFGELGAFVADGEGYFKRFMGDRLHSLNPAYPDIPLCRFREFFCCGKVIGHMKKRA